jgi:hypothetical protein
MAALLLSLIHLFFSVWLSFCTQTDHLVTNFAYVPDKGETEPCTVRVQAYSADYQVLGSQDEVLTEKPEPEEILMNRPSCGSRIWVVLERLRGCENPRGFIGPQMEIQDAQGNVQQTIPVSVQY